MLVINDISVGYKRKKEIYSVIENLSLKISQGEALTILGPSGCGKSTLLNALAGIIPLRSGSIDYIVKDKGMKLNSRTHKIGMIPQNCGLLPWKTIEQNCMMPLQLRKEAVDEAGKKEINKIYEALDIAPLLDRYPKELSGGQVQRAAVARAFILKPDLLLMDEPFSSLDAITREEAWELFLKLWVLNKPTTILVTHSIEEALYLGNRIIVMEDTLGRILYQMENPFFGIRYPESLEYMTVKQMLRQKLKTTEKGTKICE